MGRPKGVVCVCFLGRLASAYVLPTLTHEGDAAAAAAAAGAVAADDDEANYMATGVV